MQEIRHTATSLSGFFHFGIHSLEFPLHSIEPHFETLLQDISHPFQSLMGGIKPFFKTFLLADSTVDKFSLDPTPSHQHSHKASSPPGSKRNYTMCPQQCQYYKKRTIPKNASIKQTNAAMMLSFQLECFLRDLLARLAWGRVVPICRTLGSNTCQPKMVHMSNIPRLEPQLKEIGCWAREGV